MKKVLIIYHRVDYDGLFSALIANEFYKQNGDYCYNYGYNYGDEVDGGISNLIQGYDEVCMVDISFNDLDTMKFLYNSRKTILLDHHETCINLINSNGMSDWPGHREIGIGAVEITWNYFFNGMQMPEFIRRLGLYDVWNHDVIDWDSKILPIQYALRTDYGMSLPAILNDAEYILSPEALDNFEADGLFVLKYLKKTWNGWVKNYSFEVTVAGQFRGLCMLTPQFGSLPFESTPEAASYQVFVCANKKRKGDKYTYSLSLYSTPDKIGDFSLGEYVKSISQTGVGGGHACACGMELTEEQFFSLLKNKEI